MRRPLLESKAIVIPIDVDDCWNKVGTQGDGSCPELATQVHCRNCPVYAGAAAALLDRDVPPGYVDESTRHFSVPRRIGQADTASIVVFRLGTEWLGLPASVFSEFVDMRPIHSLPHRRGGVVLGLANVRGELLVCVSLAHVLGIERTARSPQTRRGAVAAGRLVVIRERETRFAFPVDEVHGIHKYSRDQATEVPATVAKGTATYTTAMLRWNDVAVGCLDEELLLYKLNRSLA